MSVNLGTAYGMIVIDTSGIAKAIATASSHLVAFESAMRRTGENLTRIGTSMVTGITLNVDGGHVAQ